MGRYKLSEKRYMLVNTLMGIASLIICLVIAVISITPQTYNINENEISSETIRSPRDVVDEISTQRLIEEAQAKVGPSYKRDTNLSQQITTKINEDFDSFVAAQESAEALYRQDQEAQLAAAQALINQATPSPEPASSASVQQSETAVASPDATPTPEPTPAPTAYVIQPYNPETTDWQSLLTEENVTELSDMLPEYLGDEDILTILTMTQTQMKDLKQAATNQLTNVLSNGVGTDNIDEVKASLSSEISDELNLTSEQRNLLSKLVSNDLYPNLIFDEEATQASKDEAAAMVTPEIFREGQNIVVRGEIVKPEQYAVLKDLGLLSSEVTSIKPYLAICFYVILMFGMYAIFLYIFNRRLLKDIKKVAILAILTAAAYGFTAIAQLVAVHIYPIFLFVILGAVLLSPKNALVYSVFLSLLLTSVTTGGQDLFSSESLTILLSTLIGSFFAVYALKDMRYRSRLIVAGAVAVIPGLVIELIVWLLGIINNLQLIQIYGIMALGGITCGIASIGVIPLIENAFKLITPTKLLELSGPDHPLLKRLMFEAPGTYHHSMLVANLAEAACDAVGGFSLMARVGAYFHDVGKLENPGYFKENQKNNYNPHDELDPIESARIIKKHVSDGIQLLKKYNVPKEVQQIVAQHHGNSIVRYFYHEALKANPDVDITEFKYQGVPPTTKEAAIIMMADVVEAAVRSMDTPSREQISERINQLIKTLYDEGQLDNAPLNRKDLGSIAEAFVNIFDGVYSTRIKYPIIKIHGAEDGDNVI